MTKEQLLDSFKNYQIVRKPGKDIRPGDSVLLKSIDPICCPVDSLIVKAVNIEGWQDGSIEVELTFYNQPEQFISNSVKLNGHNYYDIKIFN